MRSASSFLVLVLAATACSGADDDAVDTSSDGITGASHAAQVLYLAARPPSSCASGSDDARIRCLLRARYASDPVARDVALDLYTRTGGIAGVLPAQTYDGGYRGTLSFVPELPVGDDRQHLVWTRDAFADFAAFFTKLDWVAPRTIQYRYQQVDVRFFRSVGRTTPSAFTRGGGEVGYNVAGSLHTSAEAVRETLFHEMFHVNDFDRGGWSSALAPIVDAIVARCGTSTTCLAPYTPTDTVVHGGTYYAFQPGNNPYNVEYSAELATRYYGEQSARLRGTTWPGKPFKCGPSENARTWAWMRDAFFGGADLVPPCP